MNRIRSIILMFAVTIPFVGCLKQAPPAYNEEPVIAGYLFAGETVALKIVSQIAVSSETNGSGEGIDSLEVYIDCDSMSYRLLNTGSGSYMDTTLVVLANKQYNLHFEYRGKIVSASTIVPSSPVNFTQSVSEIKVTKIEAQSMPTPGSFQINDPITFEWSNNDASYFMIIVENLETSPELIRDTTSSRFRVASFRNEPAVTNQYQLRDQQFQYFGNHSIVLHHLNPDYAALYSGNSNSSQNLSNPTTNIVNGVGIFTGISTDTLFIKVNKSQ